MSTTIESLYNEIKKIYFKLFYVSISGFVLMEELFSLAPI